MLQVITRNSEAFTGFPLIEGDSSNDTTSFSRFHQGRGFNINGSSSVVSFVIFYGANVLFPFSGRTEGLYFENHSVKSGYEQSCIPIRMSTRFRPLSEPTFCFPTLLNLTLSNLEDYGYEIENIDAVQIFIDENPGLRKILDEARNVISKHFKDYRIQISIFKDEEEESQVLNIIVRSKEDFGSLLEKEFQIFQTWFKKYYKEFLGKVNFRVSPI